MSRKIMTTMAAIAMLLAGCAGQGSDTTSTGSTAEASTASVSPTADATATPSETATAAPDDNLPVKVDAKGDLKTYTLNNGWLSLDLPVAYTQVQDPTEQLPITMVNEYDKTYVGVTTVGPAKLLPAPDEYVSLLTKNLGLAEGAVAHEGKVDVAGKSAELYTVKAQDKKAHVYSLTLHDIAYELTLMGADGDDAKLKQILASVVIPQ